MFFGDALFQKGDGKFVLMFRTSTRKSIVRADSKGVDPNIPCVWKTQVPWVTTKSGFVHAILTFGASIIINSDEKVSKEKSARPSRNPMGQLSKS